MRMATFVVSNRENEAGTIIEVGALGRNFVLPENEKITRPVEVMNNLLSAQYPETYRDIEDGGKIKERMVKRYNVTVIEHPDDPKVGRPRKEDIARKKAMEKEIKKGNPKESITDEFDEAFDEAFNEDEGE